MSNEPLAAQRPPPAVWVRLISLFSRHFRRRRGALLQRHFEDLARLRIIDVGGSLHFWQESQVGIPPANITIYNLASAGDTHSVTSDEYAAIRVKTYDGARLPEPDASFDLAICNSVIEHVAPGQRSALVRELRRVARHVFLQTPAKSFPIEPHFLVPLLPWIPRSIGHHLVKLSPWRVLSRPDRETIASYYNNTNLLTYRDVQQLLPDAVILHEKVLGITKSYIAIT